MPESEGRSPMNRFANSVISVLEAPVTWFRGIFFYYFHYLLIILDLIKFVSRFELKSINFI